VETLSQQFGLSQEQQDKAFHALVECRQAYQQYLSTQRADAPAKGAGEFLIGRQVEALEGVLTAQQFAIYQTYANEEVKAERARTAEP
jgi:hypothetical protein